MPAAEHRTQIQFSKRVRPGDVPVVVDGCDVVFDPAGDLLLDLLGGDDAGFGRRGERILTQLCRGELLGDLLYERHVAVEVLPARRPGVGLRVRAGLNHLKIQHVAQERAAFASAVMDVTRFDLAADSVLPQALAAGCIQPDDGIRVVS